MTAAFHSRGERPSGSHWSVTQHAQRADSAADADADASRRRDRDRATTRPPPPASPPPAADNDTRDRPTRASAANDDTRNDDATDDDAMTPPMPAGRRRTTRYAKQVMYHFGGEEWKTWNEKMREYLIKKPDTKYQQHANYGSWSPEGGEWARAGERLLMKSLNLLALEVYYRYLPRCRLQGECRAKGVSEHGNSKR